jgi:hypothetical protein
MKSTSTFRSFNGTIYVRIPTTYEEYYNLKDRIEDAKHNGTEPECKIEDTSENKLLIEFPIW